MKIETWIEGERNRPLTIRRNCPCGVCRISGAGKGVGFLTWSDANGNGFTLWFDREEDYRELAKQLR